MPTHEKDSDVWIESKLEFWCDDTSSVPKFAEDEYYGSDFSNMIADDIVNVLDDGRSWSEGYLRHPKLSDIVICHAAHDICDHKSYSIPDLLPQ